MPLLERVGRNVRLTAAAQTLVVHTDALLARMEEAEADLEATAEQITGTRAGRGDPVRRPVPARARAASGSPPSIPALRVEVDRRRAGDVAAGARARRRSTSCSATSTRSSRARPTRGWTSSRCCEEQFRHRAAGRAPAGRATAGRSRSPRCATSRGRSARPTAHYARADDPRLPGARRLRARRPPPLQRPADAARAGRQRAGGDAAARPRARRPRAVRRHPRRRRGAADAHRVRRDPPRQRARPALNALRAALRDTAADLRSAATPAPEASRRPGGREPAAERRRQLGDLLQLARREPSWSTCTASAPGMYSIATVASVAVRGGQRVTHHAVGAAVDDVGTAAARRRGRARPACRAADQRLDFVQAGHQAEFYVHP